MLPNPGGIHIHRTGHISQFSLLVRNATEALAGVTTVPGKKRYVPNMLHVYPLRDSRLLRVGRQSSPDPKALFNCTPQQGEAT